MNLTSSQGTCFFARTLIHQGIMFCIWTSRLFSLVIDALMMISHPVCPVRWRQGRCSGGGCLSCILMAYWGQTETLEWFTTASGGTEWYYKSGWAVANLRKDTTLSQRMALHYMSGYIIYYFFSLYNCVSNLLQASLKSWQLLPAACNSSLSQKACFSLQMK